MAKDELKNKVSVCIEGEHAELEHSQYEKLYRLLENESWEDLADAMADAYLESESSDAWIKFIDHFIINEKKKCGYPVLLYMFASRVLLTNNITKDQKLFLDHFLKDENFIQKTSKYFLDDFSFDLLNKISEFCDPQTIDRLLRKIDNSKSGVTGDIAADLRKR